VSSDTAKTKGLNELTRGPQGVPGESKQSTWRKGGNTRANPGGVSTRKKDFKTPANATIVWGERREMKK